MFLQYYTILLWVRLCVCPHVRASRGLGIIGTLKTYYCVLLVDNFNVIKILKSFYIFYLPLFNFQLIFPPPEYTFFVRKGFFGVHNSILDIWEFWIKVKKIFHLPANKAIKKPSLILTYDTKSLSGKVVCNTLWRQPLKPDRYIWTDGSIL